MRLRALAVAALALAACRAGDEHGVAPEPVAPVGDEIVLCGARYSIGAPVVLWSDPGGYDAYDTRFPDEGPPGSADPDTGRRYRPGRPGGVDELAAVPPDCDDPAALAAAVDLFVVHYDQCGVSSLCFDVLQRQRGLSVHFLLDVDGTIYQTLDARETAWHAAQANARSIGVEIAQVGAWPPDALGPLERWYVEDEEGTRLRVPEPFAATVRDPGHSGRPARPGRFEGEVHGRRLVQHDFTPEQYDSLAKLLAVLCRELPRIRPDAPRDAEGRVRTDALSDAELARFSGILGHSHVTERKVDPGPAFDWERVLAETRALLEARPVRGS